MYACAGGPSWMKTGFPCSLTGAWSASELILTSNSPRKISITPPCCGLAKLESKSHTSARSKLKPELYSHAFRAAATTLNRQVHRSAFTERPSLLRAGRELGSDGPVSVWQPRHAASLNP